MVMGRYTLSRPHDVQVERIALIVVDRDQVASLALFGVGSGVVRLSPEPTLLRERFESVEDLREAVAV